MMQAGETLCGLDVFPVETGCIVLLVADDRMFLLNLRIIFILNFDTRGLKSSEICHGTEWDYQSSFMKLLYHIYVLV